MLSFTHKATGKMYTAQVHERTGYYEATLPAGRYEMRYDGMVKEITVIAGSRYTYDGALYDVKTKVEVEGSHVTLRVAVRGESDLPVRVKTENLKGMDVSAIVPVEAGEGSMEFHAEIVDGKKPFVGIVIPNNDLRERVEFVDPRLANL